jgi:hypothetical protein
MTGDIPRRFRYVLEPARRQREWRVEAAQAQIADLQRRLRECEMRSAELEAQCSRESADAAQAWQRSGDPRAQSAALAYLAVLHRRASDARNEAASIREALDTARESCVARQHELETLEQHRDSVWRAEATAIQRREAVQADSDWTIRSAGLGSER